MNQYRQQKIQNLEGKIPIKNPHLVQSLHVHNNKQIFVVYNSYIHIHSIEKIASFLPSLVCMIELNELAKRIQKQKYQDGLSEKIITSDKSKFGEIVFGEELDTKNNKLVSIVHLRERLRFLGSEFVRVRSVDIHTLGHLLVCFEDRRCVLLKRKNPQALYQQTNNLYNIANPILLNDLINNPIITSIFSNSFFETTMYTLHLSSKQSLDSTVSRISINDSGIQEKQLVYCIPEGKRKNIQSKGFIKMTYVSLANTGSDKDKENGTLFLLYYHKIAILDIGKFNAKSKNFHIIAQKEISLNDSLKEHVINSWQYYQSKPQKDLTIFLLTSTAVWQLELSLKTEGKQSISWHSSIKRKIQHTPKSNVYWVNFKGEFMQYVSPSQSQPNYVAHLAAETQNGLLVRLIANGVHYQEGYLYLGCPSRSYILQKMMHNFKKKQNGDRPWVSLSDVAWLKRYPQLKKQLIKQWHEVRTKQKQQGVAVSEQRKRLSLNFNMALQYHLQKSKQLKSQLISEKHQQYDPTHCSISNKKITIEDVLYCEQCQLYSIKQYAHNKCCPICWNALYSVQ